MKKDKAVTTDTIMQVEHLCKDYVTYRRGSGFRETIKSFFHREKVLVHAVSDVSFQVKKGTIVGILGPNGAGKSTTIKMLTGSLFASSGSIEVMGYLPSKDRQSYVYHIGAVFGQKSQLIWDIPPIDSFRMNKAIYHISNQDYDERLREMSQMFGVEDIIKRPTRVLSLGERMKCEFIMAMLHQPKVVFLDEPTIGLDVIAKQTIRSFIKKMNEKGTTFILTTHDLEDVEQLADQVVVIAHGEKVFDDSLEHLKLSLGALKIVELTLNQLPASDWTHKGVTQTKAEGVHITWEVDTTQIEIGDFLKEISKQYTFSDISIKELPMETIITKIYQQ